MKALFVIAATLSCLSALLAEGEQPPVFGAATEAVLLDVVVRDKARRPLRDLQAADFEVFEDGVRQQVEAFRIVARPVPTAGPGDAADATPAAGSPTNLPEPALIAFVFDRLTTSARHVAGQAARTYLRQGRRDDDLVAVFAIDLALHPLLSFTTNEAEIQEAVERAVSQGNTASSAASDRAEAREVALLAQETRERVAATAGSAGSRGDANGSSNNETGALVAYQLALEARVRMLQAFEKLDHDQQGFATSRGLSAVVGVLGRLPGRKTIVLFSEGLSTTTTTRDKFQALAADANRANVSIYAMDVAGLRITSSTSETREELRQANVTRPLDPDHLGTILRGFERNEDLLQLNPEAGLSDLANRTGGFFIHDTNDPSEAMARIGQDMRFHYLLSYTPTNEVYDGRFRRVAVRVKRPGAEVRARDGYRASRPAAPAPVTAPPDPADPTAAAFAALDGPAANGRFTVHAAALSLPDPATPGLVPIIVRVPSSAVTIPGAFTLVARIRGASGQVVAQASQHYPVTRADTGGPQLPDDLVLYREADLPPGPYTLEAGGYDSLTKAVAVVTRRFEVAPAAADGTRLGSVVLVRGVSPATKEAGGRARALQFGESALSPNLGEPMRKSESADLTFYIAALPPKEGPPPDEAIIEVRRGGQTLRRVATPLAPPNASGRIQTAAALPLAALAAGDYELEVSVGKGPARATSSATFRVED